jgi:hypothetical protein
MTYAPDTIKAAQAYLKAQTGLPWAALGIIGDDDHDGGYHCGWDRRDTDADGNVDDYSWEESTRDSGHKTDAASALDVGNWSGLRAFSLWLVQQCKAGAPGTKDIREVIYSPDGHTVKRWDRLGKRTSGDTSHRSHTHISYHRDAEGRDKTALFKRYFEGDDMELTDKLKPTSYTTETWGVASLDVGTALSHTYTFGRNASDKASAIRTEQATQTALLKQLLAKQSGLTEAQVAAAVAEGVRQSLPTVEEIAAAVAAAVDHDLDVAAVSEALREFYAGRLEAIA